MLRDALAAAISRRQFLKQAGLSRCYGGTHFEQGDLDARAAVQLVAEQAWTKAKSYFNGRADLTSDDVGESER